MPLVALSLRLGGFLYRAEALDQLEIVVAQLGSMSPGAT